MNEKKSNRNHFEKLDLNDPNRPIVVLDTEIADVPEASRRFLDHKIDRVQFPNGNIGWHHRIKVPEGVMVGHINSADEIALVQNYRHPLGRDSVELPSGGLEPLETEEFENATPDRREEILKAAACREFREEMGLAIGVNAVHRIFKGPLQGSVGYSDQSYHIYHGYGGKAHKQALDDGEQGMLKTFRVPLDDAAEMIGAEIVDPASSAAILKLNMLYGIHIPKDLRIKK